VYGPAEQENRKKKARRCYHRVMSGLERGGQIRFLTLTSSIEAPKDIQRSWRALYMRLKRRGLIVGYIKVPEIKNGRIHLHILFRGSFISQLLISRMWEEIHKSRVVDIRFVKLSGRKGRIANYMAKYMTKESAGRYSWSWGWVWRGFCRHWALWKKYWWNHFDVKGKTTFNNCILGWQMWLHGIYIIDIEGMKNDWPPNLVIKINV
jgi:hypothetical protein